MSENNPKEPSAPRAAAGSPAAGEAAEEERSAGPGSRRQGDDGAPPRRGELVSALPWLSRIDPALLRLLLFVGALAAVLAVLIGFSDLFLPLVLGFAIAYLFDPAVSWMARKRIPRSLGVVILALVLALLITGFFFYVVPQINQQVRRLADNLPEYQQRLQETVTPFLERTRARYPEQWEEMKTRAVEGLRANLPRLTEAVAEGLQQFFTTVRGAVLFVLNLIFVPVFAFYLLVDFPKLKDRVGDLIPRPYRSQVLARVREVDQAVASFLRGQLVIAVILAVINAVGLTLLGVPMGLLIGIVAGLANMIPYMALVVGLAPALLLAWVEHQSLPILIGVVAVFSGAQMLEGMVLSPRILGASVNLHPVWVLLAILAGGSWLGFFGMLIAVPAAAAIQVFVRHWVESYKGSRVYRGDT